MIAFFVQDYRRAIYMANSFGETMRTVDGPFRVLISDIGDTEARIFTVPEASKAAYVAARIALRRGAKTLIPISETWISSKFQREQEIELGTLVPVNAVWNLESLEKLLRNLPESCEEFPFDYKQMIPEESTWSEEGELAVGTPPFLMRNPYLANALWKSHNMIGIDKQLSGYAEAAVETDTRLVPISYVTALIEKRNLRVEPPVITEKRFEEQFHELSEDLIKLEKKASNASP